MKKWSFKTGDLLSDFNSYEIVYDRTREMLPFNAGDCLKEVTSWFGCMCVVGISMLPLSKILIVKEKFEDTYGVIRIRKSKNRQHNDLKKKVQKECRTNNDLQHITHKTKDRGTRTPEG